MWVSKYPSSPLQLQAREAHRACSSWPSTCTQAQTPSPLLGYTLNHITVLSNNIDSQAWISPQYFKESYITVLQSTKNECRTSPAVIHGLRFCYPDFNGHRCEIVLYLPLFCFLLLGQGWVHWRQKTDAFIPWTSWTNPPHCCHSLKVTLLHSREYLWKAPHLAILA